MRNPTHLLISSVFFIFTLVSCGGGSSAPANSTDVTTTPPINTSFRPVNLGAMHKSRL
jgi:hypothetical protein